MRVNEPRKGSIRDRLAKKTAKMAKALRKKRKKK